MSQRSPRRATSTLPALAGLVALLAAPSAGARFSAGDLLGTVTDADGRRLAAAAVTLSGGGGDVHRVSTDADGLFRVADLPPGNYTIEVESEGFSKAIYTPVNVRIGRTTQIRVQLAPSVEETIVVTSEPPGIAIGAEGGKLRIEAGDLEGIPSGDDPFAAAAGLPGVVVERPGPGRSSPTAVAGPGAAPGATRWAIDGVEVSDPRTGRPASLVPDLDLAGAVVVQAGGADVEVATPGLRLDLVTRRGRDEARLAVRGSHTDRDWQSRSAADPADVSSIEGVTDFGADLGGRLIRDRVWGWAGLDLQEVERRAVGGLAESSRLENVAVKLDALPFGGNSLDLAFHRGDRRREGVGAGPDRSFEATQRELEPSRLFRLEDAQVFGADLLLTGRLARVESDSSLLPESANGDVLLGPDGVWHGSYGTFHYGHESDLGSLELVAHRETGPVRHELRTGISRRDSLVTSSGRWGDGGFVQLSGENFGTPFDLVRVVRDSSLRVEQGQTAFWVQETGRWRGLTFDFGVRFDDQSGKNAGSSAAASSLVPDLLPAVELESQPAAFRWATLSPRLAVAWAAGREGRTVLRAGYASFASELDPDLVTLTNPVTGELVLAVDDAGEDERIGPGDPYFVLQRINLGYEGAKGGNYLDPRLRPERTSEVRLVAEHRFRGGLEIGVDRVERKVSNVLEAVRLVRDPRGLVRPATALDYELDLLQTGLLPDGSPYAAPVYRLSDRVTDAGGSLVRNGDRSQRYDATSLRLTHRFEDGLLVRGHVTWSDWRWHVGDVYRFHDDPTDQGEEAGPAGIASADGEGETVVPPTADGVFLNSRWAWNLLALWQVGATRPWGFDLGVHLHGRQGYPLPYSVAVVGSDGVVRTVEATPADHFRLDDVYTVDLRLEKEIELGALRAAVSVDGFNVLDSGSVLSRETRLGNPMAGTVRETMSPRVFRLGVRFLLD